VLLSLGVAVFCGLLAAFLTNMWVRARIRRLENKLAEGRAVLLVVAQKRRGRPVLQAMSRVGAVRTGRL
jgi:Flp pilus assembly protein TadB